jgi:tetratricopeptide (TPR) repeat protein
MLNPTGIRTVQVRICEYILLSCRKHRWSIDAACGIGVGIVSIAALAAAQNLPPLPHLSPDTFRPAARAAIVKVYRSASARPADAAAVGLLARTLQAWEQWDAAHHTYLRAQALAPRTFEWHYLDGVVLQRLARQADAAKRFAEAAALSPRYLPARLKLADALFEAGDLDRAQTMFSELSNELLAEPASQFGLGRIAIARGQYENAVRHLQRATALFPEFGAAHYALARSYRALGRTAEAQQALERHNQYGPRWPGVEDPVLAAVAALRNDGQAEFQRGLKLADQGDLPGAIAAHEAALASDPSLAQAHANLITLYGRTGNLAKAQEHYQALLALGANLDEAHYNMGVLLALQEKWDDAAAAYRKAIAVNPRQAQAHNNLGLILERQRDITGAAEEYRLSVESRPTFRLARFNLGRMLLALGRPQDAVSQFERLTEPRDAESPRYLFGLATAYVRSGNKTEGIRWATEARQLALQYGEKELAAAIERDLASLR